MTSQTKVTDSLDNVYVLYYIHGNDRTVKELYFRFNYLSDDLRDIKRAAIDRGRSFCDKRAWRFVRVEKFLSDLDEIEKKIEDSL